MPAELLRIVLEAGRVSKANWPGELRLAMAGAVVLWRGAPGPDGGAEPAEGNGGEHLSTTAERVASGAG